MTVYIEQRIDQLLTPSGVGDIVTANANGDFRDVVDGGVGAQDFHILCPIGGPNFLLANLSILIMDGRQPMFTAGTAGYAQQPELDEGVRVVVHDTDLNEKHVLTGTATLTFTGSWIIASTTHSIEVLPRQVTHYDFRWDFLADSGGFPLQLLPGERLSVLLNDDFTGMLFHLFAVRGIKSSLSGVGADPES